MEEIIERELHKLTQFADYPAEISIAQKAAILRNLHIAEQDIYPVVKLWFPNHINIVRELTFSNLSQLTYIKVLEKFQ